MRAFCICAIYFGFLLPLAYIVPDFEFILTFKWFIFVRFSSYITQRFALCTLSVHVFLRSAIHEKLKSKTHVKEYKTIVFQENVLRQCCGQSFFFDYRLNYRFLSFWKIDWFSLYIFIDDFQFCWYSTFMHRLIQTYTTEKKKKTRHNRIRIA